MSYELTEGVEKITASRVILSTSKGRVDISNCSSISEIKFHLRKSGLPKKEVDGTIKLLKAKVESGELKFVTDETPVNTEK